MAKRRIGENYRETGLFTGMLGFYFTMLPVGTLAVGGFGSLLRIIGLLVVVIWIVEYHEMEKSCQVIYLLLFVCWTGLSLFWTVDLTASFRRVFSYVSFFSMMAAASAYEYSDRDILFLKKSLIWSSRVTVVFVILFAGFMEGRLRMQGLVNEDPNYLCMYFSFGIVSCMEILCRENPPREKIPAIMELTIYLYFVLSTGSRGGAMAAGVMLAVAFFLTERPKKGTFRNFMTKGAVMLAVITTFMLLRDIVSKDMLERYRLTVVAASNGTGRFDIWKDAMRTFWNANLFRKVFGFGTGSAKTVSSLCSFTRISVMHNLFIENLLEVGLVGLALYTGYVFGFWNSARKSGSIFALSVITGMIVMSLSTSIYTFKPYWNIMLFILCLQKCRNRPKADTSEEKRDGRIEHCHSRI